VDERQLDEVVRSGTPVHAVDVAPPNLGLRHRQNAVVGGA